MLIVSLVLNDHISMSNQYHFDRIVFIDNKTLKFDNTTSLLPSDVHTIMDSNPRPTECAARCAAQLCYAFIHSVDMCMMFTSLSLLQRGYISNDYTTISVDGKLFTSFGEYLFKQVLYVYSLNTISAINNWKYLNL